jgi:hypothetical protein
MPNINPFLKPLLLLVCSSCCLNCPIVRVVPCQISEATWQRILTKHSNARVWNELTLHAVRQVLPQPTVHARNLFHVSAAMYDAWAAYDATATQVLVQEKVSGSSADQAIAVAYAANRVLRQRYANTVGNSDVLDCFQQGLQRSGLNPNQFSTTGNAAADVGNRIAQTILDNAIKDGANEVGNYTDTTDYVPSNPVLRPEIPSLSLPNPSLWQPLLLQTPFTQNNIPQNGPQVFVTPHWRNVTPFSMQRTGELYHDPGAAPQHDSPAMQTWVVDVLQKQSLLDRSSQTMDTSPASLGNNTLGTNDGHGHGANPITNLPYTAILQERSAYWRTVAEYWADGPTSETPPGHWNVVVNTVRDHPDFLGQWQGTGMTLSPLEWDVKTYLVLNGALHDAAIAAWEIKRITNTARPISLVRFLEQRKKLPLVAGLIEEKNGVVMVKSSAETWIPASEWVPFQRFDFVTPAFPGFVSGHSTFSHAAAVILEKVTGSRFFPSGLAQHTVPAFSNRIGESIRIDVHLQWATYADAADQAGQSRLWGGIHIEPDDLVGRQIGHKIGLGAFHKAQKYFLGSP